MNGSSTGKQSVGIGFFPITASYLFGASNHNLKLGGGVTLVHISAKIKEVDLSSSIRGNGALATAILGYRYMPSDNPFVFRAGFTPL